MFRTLAYLSPLIVGFGIAAALALTNEKPWRRRLCVVGVVLGSMVLLLAVAAVTETFLALLEVSVLLIAFAALVAGLFFLGEACGLPREVSQILCGVLVVALMSTVFWAGPIIRDSPDQSAAATHDRITDAVAANPYLVMGYSIFNFNPLHGDALRPLGLHDYQFDWPSWKRTSGGYALFGLLFFGAGMGVRAVRKRLAP